MMSKILQLVIPFWMLARKYTDEKVALLEHPACELAVSDGVLTVIVHDPKLASASITDGALVLNV